MTSRDGPRRSSRWTVGCAYDEIRSTQPGSCQCSQLVLPLVANRWGERTAGLPETYARNPRELAHRATGCLWRDGSAAAGKTPVPRGVAAPDSRPFPTSLHPARLYSSATFHPSAGFRPLSQLLRCAARSGCPAGETHCGPYRPTQHLHYSQCEWLRSFRRARRRRPQAPSHWRKTFPRPLFDGHVAARPPRAHAHASHWFAYVGPEPAPT